MEKITKNTNLVGAIRCKECIHRPNQIVRDDGSVYWTDFPDGVCPCQSDNEYYCWYPSDDWFCANGERK